MAFSKPRNYWSTLARGILMLAKYNLEGTKEVFFDIIHAKYNKTGEKNNYYFSKKILIIINILKTNSKMFT